MIGKSDTFDDTIIAPATIPGTGAISLLRISGADSFDLVDKLVRFKNGTAATANAGTVKFGNICDGQGNELDEVLCSIFHAPHSYTGEDSVELTCHASSYIVSTILALAIKTGARLAEPGEFTRRAFINGKMDLTQAEAVADVIASGNETAHRIAFKQMKGGFSAELTILRERLLEMSSLLELELDFSEEEVEFADRNKLLALLEETIAHVDKLSSSFRLGNAIKNGVPVAIVGAPNAGKSTLLNAILGEERAIVSPIPGTTRDTIEECINIDGIQFRFIDTAGLREKLNRNDSNASEESGNNEISDGKTSTHDLPDIEAIGIERSLETIQKAQIVLILLDAVILCNTSNDLHLLQLHAIKQIISSIDLSSQKLFLVLNKTDLLDRDDQQDLLKLKTAVNKNVSAINQIVSFINNQSFTQSLNGGTVKLIPISAKLGTGVKTLLEALSKSERDDVVNISRQSVLVTNLRHYEALVNSRNCLSAVRLGLLSDTAIDLIAEDLRAAISTLGSITGEISNSEILENIFSKFCIGK